MMVILYVVAGVLAVWVIRMLWLDEQRRRVMERSRSHGRYVR